MVYYNKKLQISLPPPTWYLLPGTAAAKKLFNATRDNDMYLIPCLPIRAYLTAGSPARQNALLCTAVGILGILLRNERVER